MNLLTFGQTAPGPDISPLAYWGVAGVLLTFILWLYLDERKEHKTLREKMLTEALPALIENNEQMRESAAAMERMTLMAHQIAGRPNLDPVQFVEWVATMREVKRMLDDERIRRTAWEQQGRDRRRE